MYCSIKLNIFHVETVPTFDLLLQVYLFIMRSLGSIKLDRVISETRYSDLGKGGYELKLD